MKEKELECGEEFCYLGSLVSSCEGIDEAVIDRSKKPKRKSIQVSRKVKINYLRHMLSLSLCTGMIWKQLAETTKQLTLS